MLQHDTTTTTAFRPPIVWPLEQAEALWQWPDFTPNPIIVPPARPGGVQHVGTLGRSREWSVVLADVPKLTVGPCVAAFVATNVLLSAAVLDAPLGLQPAIFVNFSRPLRGPPWCGLYAFDWDARMHGAVPRDLGLVRVDLDLDWRRGWYAKDDWTAFVWTAIIGWRNHVYHPFLWWLHRTGMIAVYANERFSWRRHFRPWGAPALWAQRWRREHTARRSMGEASHILRQMRKMERH